MPAKERTDPLLLGCGSRFLHSAPRARQTSANLHHASAGRCARLRASSPSRAPSSPSSPRQGKQHGSPDAALCSPRACWCRAGVPPLTLPAALCREGCVAMSLVTSACWRPQSMRVALRLSRMVFWASGVAQLDEGRDRKLKQKLGVFDILLVRLLQHTRAASGYSTQTILGRI